jgi:hypothetical protein
MIKYKILLITFLTGVFMMENGEEAKKNILRKQMTMLKKETM